MSQSRFIGGSLFPAVGGCLGLAFLLKLLLLVTSAEGFWTAIVHLAAAAAVVVPSFLVLSKITGQECKQVQPAGPAQLHRRPHPAPPSGVRQFSVQSAATVTVQPAAAVAPSHKHASRQRQQSKRSRSVTARGTASSVPPSSVSSRGAEPTHGSTSSSSNNVSITHLLPMALSLDYWGKSTPRKQGSSKRCSQGDNSTSSSSPGSAVAAQGANVASGLAAAGSCLFSFPNLVAAGTAPGQVSMVSPGDTFAAPLAVVSSIARPGHSAAATTAPLETAQRADASMPPAAAAAGPAAGGCIRTAGGNIGQAGGDSVTSASAGSMMGTITAAPVAAAGKAESAAVGGTAGVCAADGSCLVATSNTPATTHAEAAAAAAVAGAGHGVAAQPAQPVQAAATPVGSNTASVALEQPKGAVATAARSCHIVAAAVGAAAGVAAATAAAAAHSAACMQLFGQSTLSRELPISVPQAVDALEQQPCSHQHAEDLAGLCGQQQQQREQQQVQAAVQPHLLSQDLHGQHQQEEQQQQAGNGSCAAGTARSQQSQDLASFNFFFAPVTPLPLIATSARASMCLRQPSGNISGLLSSNGGSTGGYGGSISSCGGCSYAHPLPSSAQSPLARRLTQERDETGFPTSPALAGLLEQESTTHHLRRSCSLDCRRGTSSSPGSSTLQQQQQEQPAPPWAHLQLRSAWHLLEQRQQQAAAHTQLEQHEGASRPAAWLGRRHTFSTAHDFAAAAEAAAAAVAAVQHNSSPAAAPRPASRSSSSNSGNASMSTIARATSSSSGGSDSYGVVTPHRLSKSSSGGLCGDTAAAVAHGASDGPAAAAAGELFGAGSGCCPVSDGGRMCGVAVAAGSAAGEQAGVGADADGRVVVAAVGMSYKQLLSMWSAMRADVMPAA